jgi:hypothetical protein
MAITREDDACIRCGKRIDHNKSAWLELSCATACDSEERRQAGLCGPRGTPQRLTQTRPHQLNSPGKNQPI